MLIDINDYKTGISRNIKKIKVFYLFVSILFIIGLIIINRCFKYYDYYYVSLEYKEQVLNMYIPTSDIIKITKNNKIKIENKIFAYNVDSISSENIYMNGYYYKLIKLKIGNNDLKDNEVIKSKIIVSEDSLIGYIFKTVWR